MTIGTQVYDTQTEHVGVVVELFNRYEMSYIKINFSGGQGSYGYETSVTHFQGLVNYGRFKI